MIIEIYHHDRAKELLIVTKIYIIYIFIKTCSFYTIVFYLNKKEKPAVELRRKYKLQREIDVKDTLRWPRSLVLSIC